jgi:16S rRNA (cytosine1402-N4)-methyltransferase
MTVAAYHTPVMIEEVARQAEGRGRIVDCTVGGGGHAARLASTGVQLLAIDRDAEAIVAARRQVGATAARWLRASFADPTALAAIAAFVPDFVLFDLGVSAHHFESTDRGFSFKPGVPLDMRMSREEGTTAAQLLNSLGQKELARVFREYGDERRSARLAAVLARRRQKQPLETSDHLVNAIREALGPRSGPRDFARLFQAVRIAINDEIGALETALPAVLDALVPGGMIAVISYHSGEDRVVKRFFREWARACVCPPHIPQCMCRGRQLGVATPRKPIRPTAREVVTNPRARSAKLRIFRKSDENQG